MMTRRRRRTNSRTERHYLLSFSYCYGDVPIGLYHEEEWPIMESAIQSFPKAKPVIEALSKVYARESEKLHEASSLTVTVFEGLAPVHHFIAYVFTEEDRRRLLEDVRDG